MCIRSREKGVVIQTVVRSTINLENVRFFDQATLKINPDISNQQSAISIYICIHKLPVTLQEYIDTDKAKLLKD